MEKKMAKKIKKEDMKNEVMEIMEANQNEANS